MRRKLKNLKNKSGHSENGSPRQLIDECVYRESMNRAAVVFNGNNPGPSPFWDSNYSGLSHASRPRDSAISLRSVTQFEEN